MDDLPSLDKELYQGLIFLKNYQGNVEDDLGLNFTVSSSGAYCSFKSLILLNLVNLSRLTLFQEDQRFL